MKQNLEMERRDSNKTIKLRREIKSSWQLITQSELRG